MTGRTGHLAAVDLGATSGRVMLATGCFTTYAAASRRRPDSTLT